MAIKEIVGEELFTKLTASTDETIKAVVAKLSDSQVLIAPVTEYVPKRDFNEKIELAKGLKAQIQKAEDDLKALKEASAGNATLQAQITELQNANKATRLSFEAEQAKMKKDFALKASLLNAGVGDEKARNLLSKEFDLDKIELDDKGEVKGIVDLLKPIKDNQAFKSMFGTTVLQGQEHKGGESANSDVAKLEAQLIDAQKRGKMSEVVAIRNQIFELNKGK